jgi:acyl transferase domain-containing protein/3-hydroxymyristoyl/3-hydroxydecanoyl-(acyl carrier protein) dehydratase
MTLPRIAIVAMGGCFPPSATPDGLWQAVVAGADLSRDVPPNRWLLSPEEILDPSGPRPDAVLSCRGYFLDALRVDSKGLALSAKRLEPLDPVFHLTLAAGRQAWDAAVTRTLDRARVGVILGNIVLPTEKASAIARACLGRTLAERAPQVRTIGDDWPHPDNRSTALPAALLARALGLGGGSYTLDAACASSLYAIYLAAAELRAGRADAVLAGGVSRPDCLYTQMGFSQLRALSPSGRCRPFDAGADGLVVGEGAGIFVLKRLDDARRDGDRVLAVIAGCGVSNDIEGSLLAPSSEGQLRAMRAAYAEAGWVPQDVDLIECHATGTPVGDAIEFRSLRELWGHDRWRPGQCVVGSVKSTVGHLLTAAGAAALCKVLASFQTKTLPPMANFAAAPSSFEIDSSPFCVLREPILWLRRSPETPRRAAISGFGFGGINAHLLLEEVGEGDTPERPKDERRQLTVAITDSPAIAIVGIAAQFGPWKTLDALARRLLFGDPNAEPQRPRRWWGVPESEWFRAVGLDAATFAGFYLDEVSVDAGHFRIPPRELEEMLPQQLLMLKVAEDAMNPLARREALARAGTFIGLGLDLNTTNFHLRWSVLAATKDRSLADAASVPLNADRTLGALGSIVASRIARHFRMGGPSFAVCGEENSGLRALDTAVRALQRGALDLALVGAVDLCGDVRVVLTARKHGEVMSGEGAVAFVLKRLDDARRDGDCIRAVIRDNDFSASANAAKSSGVEHAADLRRTARLLGDCGAASGLAALLDAVFALECRILPDPPRHWLRDRTNGPRRAVLRCVASDGQMAHVLLEEEESTATRYAFPHVGPEEECLFVVQGHQPAEVCDELDRLRVLVNDAQQGPLRETARRWWQSNRTTASLPRAVALLARDRASLRTCITEAHRCLTSSWNEAAPSAKDNVFYSPDPLGPRGEVAFVFPGSGHDFPAMGRDLALRWPEVLLRQDAENDHLASQYVGRAYWTATPTLLSPRDRLFGQVALTTLVTDILGRFSVRPSAAIGYSLGESAALFALRAWTDRDAMYRALNRSSLFTDDLTGRCNAARRHWRLSNDEGVDWVAGVVGRSAEEVRAACAGVDRVYLLIVNAPRECVLGGQHAAVAEVLRRLDTALVPFAESMTVHCPVVREVAEAYQQLHRLPVSPINGVRFYSAALGRSYEISRDSSADAILAQALDTIDFPAVVESAWRDGARLFVEVGPGASCSRLIDGILGSRRHRACSACVPGGGVSSLLRVLAVLCAERVPVDLSPLYNDEPREAPVVARTSVVVPVGREPFSFPHRESDLPASDPNKSGRVGTLRSTEQLPLDNGSRTLDPSDIAPVTTPDTFARQVIAAQVACGDAHSVYLRHAESVQRGMAETIAFQTTLLEEMVRRRLPVSAAVDRIATSAPRALDRSQCLEFAVGSIAQVLGSEFAEVDEFPTRVRLPDEPLMLVDRILTIEGEPRLLTRGRVVTEHDIQRGAWYLDGGRIPTCIAVEAGQADLFLSGYLGIDFHTRGLAVYRLLDAVVTFHRSLPEAGCVIRYDIHIDDFFRQGPTMLFRFRFTGTVDGEPLLTMTDGCAGFFTQDELSAGRGIVQTELDRRPRRGVRPPETLIPTAVESYDETQLDALRAGDLAECFGPLFANRQLAPGLRLPGGRMRLVDRVLRLDPDGGRYGVGLIRAEAEIDPKAWFLTCHFVDDQVMPGTLMYECCLHTLRIFLLRTGWIATDGDVGCGPVPGVASRLKCRGQVTASTRTVAYEVTVKERGYRPEPYALADALIYADGKAIVEIHNLSLRITGIDLPTLQRLWQREAATERVPLFGPEKILAFAIGKPSEAYGEPYRIFDEDRVIARLPGPPYQFLDRIVAIRAEPWKMIAGGEIEAEYDVPPDAWYFEAERQPIMPFAVLLEVALQPCGWLAAYLGSALTSPTDLSFRNLGGSAALVRSVGADAGMLATRVRITSVSSSAGMILQSYAFEVSCRGEVIYRGSTSFGFFSKSALAQQVGLRDARFHEPTEAERAQGRSFEYPIVDPFPDSRLRMIDQVELLVADGGPAGLGLIEGMKRVMPSEWFFKAHFHQDPVCPGSLGLESLLQLLKVLARERWPEATRFETMTGGAHQWTYRGQVVPTDGQVRLQAVVTACDLEARRLTADGLLAVDGRVIYRMQDFTIRAYSVEP